MHRSLRNVSLIGLTPSLSVCRERSSNAKLRLRFRALFRNGVSPGETLDPKAAGQEDSPNDV